MLGRAVGTHKAEDPVRLVGIRGPDLLAVDQVMITLVFAARLQAGEVRSRARLRIPLAPAGLALQDVGDEAQLLFVITELEQRRAEHPEAEREERRARLDAAHFLFQHARLRAAQAAAAILLGPFRRGPALLAHPVEPEFGFRVLEGGITPAPHNLVIRHRRAHRGRAILLQPLAGVGAERLELLGIVIGHRLTPSDGAVFGATLSPRPASAKRSRGVRMHQAAREPKQNVTFPK